MSRRIRAICAHCKKDIMQKDIIIESDRRGVPKHTYHASCVVVMSDKIAKRTSELIEKREKKRLKELEKKEKEQTEEVNVETGEVTKIDETKDEDKVSVSEDK